MEKFLLIRFSSMGDIIFSTPLPTKIKENYPSCKVHFLTLEDFVPLLEQHPNIDRIIALNRNVRLLELRHLSKAIDDENYHAIFDIHNSLRSKLLKWYSKNGEWTVYKKNRLRRFLLFYLHINQFSNTYNISDNYLKSVNRIIQGDSLSQPQIHLTRNEKKRALKFINSYSSQKEYITIIPGAAWRTKRWLLNYYIKLVQSLNQNFDIVILGGENDTICDEIAQKVPGAINLKGKTDLRTAMAIMSNAKLAIGSDTGLIHGAEAVGTPVVLITGPTSHETGAHVRLDRSVETGIDLWCKPCSKNGSRPCFRKEQYCMVEITPEMVMDGINRALA
ncbi:MAG: lipopolysaccharide heptosyltransferase II [Candidatus Marinimicrobia bacterium]|nr:lipopolysaccharide heptosyltransferase II [Candidatus Neomarinimicrobiota bacterium]